MIKKDSEYESGRYPKFATRLRPEDRKALEKIKEHYKLRTLADGIRLALRVLLFIATEDYWKDDFSVPHVLEVYKADNPDSWKILLGGKKDN